MNALQLLPTIDARFISGNRTPIERTYITAAEWQALREATQLADILAIGADALQAQNITAIIALRGFAQSIMESWPDGGPDGGDVQDAAETFGLLHPTTATEACGDHCNCAEYDDFPQTCFRKTPLLTGKPA